MLPMYKRYADCKPVGTAYISGTFGLIVYEPDENDKFDCDFICSWHNGETEWGHHKHKIHLNNGRPFIRKGNLRIYMDEIMRV